MSEFLIVVLALWAISAIIVAIRHHYQRGHRIECIGCRNRRRLVRVAVVLWIAAMVLFYDSGLHWPDLGFLALALIVEFS